MVQWLELHVLNCSWKFLLPHLSSVPKRTVKLIISKMSRQGTFQGKGRGLSPVTWWLDHCSKVLWRLLVDLSIFWYQAISFPVVLSFRGCYLESEIHALLSLQNGINDTAKTTSPMLLQNVNNFRNLLNFIPISLYLQCQRVGISGLSPAELVSRTLLQPQGL